MIDDIEIDRREPVMLDGAPIRDVLIPAQTDLGFFGSAAVGWQSAAVDFEDSWGGILDSDDGDFLTEEAHKAGIGERKIPFELGLTSGQLRRQINKYDRDLWLSKQDTNVFGELLGSLVPSLFEPSGIAALAVGAGAAGAVYKATGRKLFATALHAGQAPGLGARAAAVSAAAGAELVVGSEAGALAEVTISSRRLGTADAARIESFAALPANPYALGLTALGAGVATALVRPRAQAASTYEPSAAETVIASDPRMPLDPNIKGSVFDGKTQADAQQADTAFANIDLPPTGVAPAPAPAPRGRLDDMFRGYPGGLQTWLREVSSGAEQAIAYAGDLGIDAASVRTLLSDASTQQARTMRRSADELQGLYKAAQDPADPTNAASLRAAGMLGDEGLLPPFQNLAARAATPIDTQVPKALANKALVEEGRALTFADPVDQIAYQISRGGLNKKDLSAASKALKDAGFDADSQTALVKSVSDAARAAVQSVPPGEAVAVSSGRTRAPIGADADPLARRNFMEHGPEAMLLDAGLPVRTPPAHVDAAALIHAIEAGKAFGGVPPPGNLLPPKAPRPEPVPAKDPQAPKPAPTKASKAKTAAAAERKKAAEAKEIEQSLNDDPLRADIMEHAKSLGVDLTDVAKVMDDMIKDMKKCA